MINFVEYVKQLWDTTVKFGPTRMNHMEDGIKGNSDAVVDLNEALGNTSISTIGDGTVTGAISAINSNLTNYLKVVRATFSNISLNSGNFSASLDIPIQSGYSPIGIVGYSIENRDYGNTLFVTTSSFNSDKTKISFMGKNTGNQVTINPYFDILYLKN